MSTLAAAQAGDEAAFATLVAGYRRELSAHCYRMLGSPQDAEDALQETLVAAWRGLAGFEQRSSLRAWLYRIATHVCLRLGSRRPARVLSWEHAPARRPDDDLGAPVAEPVFLEPWPDDPEEAYGRKESVELAYVAALQHLPPNQRAVLVLREVLAFSAAEVAQMLDTSIASVTSALQRARATVAQRVPRSQQAELASAEHRAAVTAFVAAWERMDLPVLVALLTEDVRFTMPPLPAWFDGRADVTAFLRDRVFATPWKLRPLTVNAQPALACYQGPDRFRLGAVNVLGLRDGRVRWIAAFLDPAVLARFGLPEEI